MTEAMGLEGLKACAGRELAMRRNVYPRWVQSGRMKQAAADKEIAGMEAIVRLLERLADDEGLANALVASDAFMVSLGDDDAYLANARAIVAHLLEPPHA